MIYNVRMTLDNEKFIDMELYEEVAPISVKNFLKLVDNHYFDGIIFHRIIRNFMVQTGGYKIDGNELYEADEVESIKGEFASNGVENNLKHTLGVVSMARTNVKDSASSQFFICTADAPHLDGQYAAFGRVCDNDSLQVVLDISYTQTFYVNQMFINFPIYAIIIESIERA